MWNFVIACMLYLVVGLCAGSPAVGQSNQGQLAQDASDDRPWLGVALQDLAKSDMPLLAGRETSGAHILVVYPGGPADGKMRAGDIVIGVGPLDTPSSAAASAAIATHAPATLVGLRFMRDGSERFIQIRSVKRMRETDLEDLFQKGRSAHDLKNYTEAMRLYRLATSFGSERAMNNIGVLFGDGLGVAKDTMEAERWYRVSSLLGNTIATANVGWTNLQRKNYTTAKTWFEKGAAQEHANSLFGLGQLYRDGLGVARDVAAARKFYARAAKAGDTAARDALAALDARQRRASGGGSSGGGRNGGGTGGGGSVLPVYVPQSPVFVPPPTWVPAPPGGPVGGPIGGPAGGPGGYKPY